MNRWKAAALHLSLSALFVSIIASLVLGLWYPPPYFSAAGANRLMSLLAGVQLALGPLLTLIVFRAGKRGLRFDLACIGLLQVIALTYGLLVVLESRPVFLVGAVDRFVLVSANEIADADLAMGTEVDFSSRSWTGPRLVVAELPTDPTERSDLAFSALSGRDIQNLPKYYRDYARAGKVLLAKAKPLDELRERQPHFYHLISDWLTQSGRSNASVVWLPLQTRRDDLVMLLDASTAQPLRALAINPW